MMIGESADVSQRVRRSLPQTVLGRTAFTWFTPGPFKGYQFAVLNMLAISIFVGVFFYASRDYNVRQRELSVSACIWLMFVFWGYLAFYLGLAHLIVRAASKVTTTSPVFGVLIGVLVFLVGSLIPVTIRMSLDDLVTQDYAWWEITNPFASIRQLLEFRPVAGSSPLIKQIRGVAISMGAIVYLVNNLICVAQMRPDREAAPERVLRERGGK